MKVRISLLFSSVLVMSGGTAAYASTLSRLAGPTTAALSANFDRYDVDTKTGKTQGPIKGHVQFQRPGYFILTMADQQIKIVDGKLEYIPCANCKPVSMAAASVVNGSLLELIDEGRNAESLFFAQSQINVAQNESSEAYSLAALGFAQGRFNLSSYKDQPTVAELNLIPEVKTILQFYDVQRSLVNLQEKIK